MTDEAPVPARGAVADHATRGTLFLVVGGSAAVVTWLVFQGLDAGLHVERHLANVLAYEAGIGWSFLGHSILTFRTMPARRSPLMRFLRFHAVALVGLAVNLAVFSALHDGFHVEARWAELAAIPAATPFNYLGQRYWTWA